MQRALILSCLIGFGCLVAVQPAYADPIILTGSPNAHTSWRDIYTEIKRVVPSPDIGTVTTSGPHSITSSQVTVQDTIPPAVAHDYYATSSVTPYHFTGDTVGEETLSATGYFQDDIYFATANHLPGYLEFDFDVVYKLGAFGPGGSAMFNLGLDVQGVDVTPFTASLTNFCSGIPCEPLFSEFNGVATLSTYGTGYLLASDSYFALTFSISAEATVGLVTWYAGQQFGEMDPQGFLRAVRAYELVPGTVNQYRLLDNSEYTLRSANGNDLRPVPEPASLFLLGTGLAGLVAARWRRR